MSTGIQDSLSLSEGVCHQVERNTVSGKEQNLMNLPLEMKDGSSSSRELLGIHVQKVKARLKAIETKIP